MGSDRAAIAAQLYMDLCVAGAELESESLSISRPGGEFRPIPYARDGRTGSRLDSFHRGIFLQRDAVRLRSVHHQVARSDWRSLATAPVFAATAPARDELDAGRRAVRRTRHCATRQARAATPAGQRCRRT